MSKIKENIPGIVLYGAAAAFFVAASYYRYECVKEHGVGAKECIMFPEEALGYHWKHRHATPE